jgi:hypothetical protein
VLLEERIGKYCKIVVCAGVTRKDKTKSVRKGNNERAREKKRGSGK